MSGKTSIDRLGLTWMTAVYPFLPKSTQEWNTSQWSVCFVVFKGWDIVIVGARYGWLYTQFACLFFLYLPSLLRGHARQTHLLKEECWKNTGSLVSFHPTMLEIKENPARQANMGGVQYLPVDSPTLNKQRLVQPLCLVFASICTVCLNVTGKKRCLCLLWEPTLSQFSRGTQSTPLRVRILSCLWQHVQREN